MPTEPKMVYCHPLIFRDLVSVMDGEQVQRVIIEVMNIMMIGIDPRTEYGELIPPEDWKHIERLLGIMQEEPTQSSNRVAHRRRCK